MIWVTWCAAFVKFLEILASYVQLFANTVEVVDLAKKNTKNQSYNTWMDTHIDNKISKKKREIIYKNHTKL